MTTDAWLAIAHHLAVFGVLAVLAIEWALVRPGIGAADVDRIARVDAAYGALAAVVLAAGFTRVFAGDKPTDFYLENPVFWAKIAAFAVVGLVSIGPTLRYVRWRRAAAGGGGPAAGEVAAARRAIAIELAVFATIPALAAVMARGIGL
jgi:putative membrane protein